jgi:hypothetical protein
VKPDIKATLQMIRIVSLLFILACSASAQAQSGLERSILDLSSRKFDWLIKKQADSLNRVLDERVLYIHSNGWIQNKKEIVDDMVSGKLIYQKVTITEANARIYGQTAIVTGIGTFEGINSGTAFAINLRYTEVYVSNGKGWMLTSRHSNRMP